MDTPVRESVVDEDLQQLGFARHLAYVVGIDAYQRVAPLRTAVADAELIAAELARVHHFETGALLRNATGAQLREWLAGMRAAVRADDRVIVYFAGHGIAADGDDGPAGYIVPADADPADPSTFLPMAELQDALDALPCRHLLLVLDCCFSGAFKWSSRHRAIGTLMPKRIYRQRFDRFARDAAWQILTSAAHDQKALDVLSGTPTGERGAVALDDGRQHSPFALALVRGLSGAADAVIEREGDGVLTATELYAFVRDEIEPATIRAGERLRQTPSFFPLRKHDKGEFMFLHPRHRLNLPSKPEKSPFKGLASFEEADKDLFYGRSRVVAELRRKAAAGGRLLVVVGASGTGKSSVVKAGLLPKLREEGRRVLRPIRPGATPTVELARAEAELKAAASGRDDAVVVIDQYEELVTRCTDRAERARFEQRLATLLQPGQGLALVIVTVRSDFEVQFHESVLKDAWLAGRITVPPFSVEEFREVIVMPTMQAVMVFEPESLVDRIIQDVVQSPGALPLLSYTLQALFERNQGEGRALREADYEALGGAMGAMARQADAVLASFDAAGQELVRRVMLRMVSVEGDLASRRVPKAELVFEKTREVPTAAAEAVLQKLVDARLIVGDGDHYEPAHDALVRNWPQIRKWVDDAGRDKLKLDAQITEATREYLGQRGHRSYLWHNDPRLTAARQEVASERRILNVPEVKFVNRSKRHSWYRRFGSLGSVLLALLGVLIWAVIRLAIDGPGEKRAAAMLSRMSLASPDSPPGSVCVRPQCTLEKYPFDNTEEWNVVSRFTPGPVPHESPVFAAWREDGWFGTGRILVYAADTLASETAMQSQPDNLIFIDSALRFVRAGDAISSIAGTACSNAFGVVYWPIGAPPAPTRLRALAEARGWGWRETSPQTLAADLDCAHVLWIVGGPGAAPAIESAQVKAISDALGRDMGLVVAGSGAARAALPPGTDYGPNTIGRQLGFAFTTDRHAVEPDHHLKLSFQH